MKRRLAYIFSFVLAFSFQLFAFSSKAQQLKLGNNPTQIEKSAVLELESPNQGLLLTRVSDTSDITGIDGMDPPDGMIIYFTDDDDVGTVGANAGLYIRKGGWWQQLVLEDNNGVETINGDGTKDQMFKVYNGNNFDDYNPGYPVIHEPIIIDKPSGEHVLVLPYASNGFDGLVSNNQQTWVGEKRFKDPIGVESLSPGSVPFIGPDDYNYLSEDNARLFWDNTNHRLGIGTNSPSNTLTINSGSSANESGLTLENLTSSSPVTAGAGLIGVNYAGKVVRAGIARTITNSVIRTLNTEFTISTTQMVYVTYTIKLKATVTSTGSQNARVSLDIKPVGGSWTTIASGSLAFDLGSGTSSGSSITQTMSISGWIPAGATVRLKSTGNTIYVTGQEVKMNY